jgi:hypothetical protein
MPLEMLDATHIPPSVAWAKLASIVEPRAAGERAPLALMCTAAGAATIDGASGHNLQRHKQTPAATRRRSHPPQRRDASGFDPGVRGFGRGFTVAGFLLGGL